MSLDLACLDAGQTQWMLTQGRTPCELRLVVVAATDNRRRRVGVACPGVLVHRRRPAPVGRRLVRFTRHKLDQSMLLLDGDLCGECGICVHGLAHVSSVFPPSVICDCPRRRST
jgi:hypothetical protein